MAKTFSKEFRSMLEVCIFMPFLHRDTPKPMVIPKSEELKLEWLRPDPGIMSAII